MQAVRSSVLVATLLCGLAGACSSETPAPILPPDGSIIFGGDGPPVIRIDAQIFDAPLIDARPPADAPPVFDASPFDAPIGDRFDVAYVSEWNLNGAASGAFTADQLGVFINTGTTNLDMSTLTILSITDDSGNADFRWFIEPGDVDTRTMTPGTAHGANGNTHVEPLITPLVPEPNDGSMPTPVVKGGVTARPGGDVHPKVMVQIGDAVAELDFLIHVTGNGGDAVTFVKAARVTSMLPPDAGVTKR
jgi:hypothetical protein